MFDFTQFTQNLKSIKTKTEFSKYLESCFTDLEGYFNTLKSEELNELKFEIEELLYDLEDHQLILHDNTPIINAFLILLAQKFEQAGLIGAITNILNYLPQCGVKNRLEAAKLYLKVNDISKDYFNQFHKILMLISTSVCQEEVEHNAINALGLYYLTALAQFTRVQNSSLANQLKDLFISHKEQYPLLKNPLIQEIVSQISIENYAAKISTVKEKMDSSTPSISNCHLTIASVKMEEGVYAQKLHSLSEPSFDKIREIAFSYIKSIGDSEILYEQLLRGEAIIDTVDLLYKYMVSFGAKHKIKLYSAFDAVADKLHGETVNVIDWGCGQALASVTLLNYIEEKHINLTVKNICLIEPSSLALSRGLLHVDIFKINPINVVGINSNLDCLNQEELYFDKNCKTIHLFSNILDIEGFTLNTDFFHKVSSTLQNDSLFVCVSPNINDKRNTRLDLFYKFFDENYDTTLISARNSDVSGHKRYEKIFDVRIVTQTSICEDQTAIVVTPNSGHFNFLVELNQYHDYISPILNMQKVEESIHTDPEYIIFKIRKVTETLTSKVYTTFESNAESISFSDKIRYLSYEKKVFSKSMTNYLHTIRSIGNRGVHEEVEDLLKLKLDAHLMIFALISLIKEFKESKLI